MPPCAGPGTGGAVTAAGCDPRRLGSAAPPAARVAAARSAAARSAAAAAAAASVASAQAASVSSRPNTAWTARPPSRLARPPARTAHTSAATSADAASPPWASASATAWGSRNRAVPTSRRSTMVQAWCSLAQGPATWRSTRRRSQEASHRQAGVPAEKMGPASSRYGAPAIEYLDVRKGATSSRSSAGSVSSRGQAAAATAAVAAADRGADPPPAPSPPPQCP